MDKYADLPMDLNAMFADLKTKESRSKWRKVTRNPKIIYNETDRIYPL